jgi:ACS family tartrate transporter-like MFS transporter
LEQRVISKLAARLVPLLCVCFVAAFVDRVNVGFAKLSMSSDLELSEQTYATGAGIFFIGYFLCEVPSNLALQRFGARRWIARIMLVWGVISCAMALVEGKASFYLLRFLLGVAEAGFFPGVIYYLSSWFPRDFRTRVVAWFMLAAVMSFIIGSPLSGLLLDHPVFGLEGWQTLFVVESIPSIALAFVVYRSLPDRPEDAAWLTAEEQAWLRAKLDSEAASDPAHATTLAAALRTPSVWLLSAIYFLTVVGGYGFDFFAPTLLAESLPGLSKTRLGLLLTIPPLVALPVMVWVGRVCDRHGNQRLAVALGSLGFALGLALLATGLEGAGAVAAMALCVAARWSLVGPFWVLPRSVLGASAAAGGIAFINSLGNLGGQAGPLLLSSLANGSGSHANGLIALAGLLVLGALLTRWVPAAGATRTAERAISLTDQGEH